MGAIALAVMIYVEGPRTIAHSLMRVGLWFVPLVLLDIVSTAIDATALFVLAAPGSSVRWRDAIVAQFVGRGVNEVTPLGSVGEVSKVSILAERSTAARATATVVIANLLTNAVTAGIIAVSGPIVAIYIVLPAPWPWLLRIAGSLLVVIIVVITWLLSRGALTAIAKRAAKRGWIPDRVVAFTRDFEKHLRHPTAREKRARVRAFALLVGSRALNWVSLWLTLAALGHIVSVGRLIAITSAGVLISIVGNIIPLGVGLVDGGQAALFAAIGLHPALGISFSLSRRLVRLFYPLVGIPLAMLRGTRRKKH